MGPNETLQSIFPRGVPNDCPALSVDDINKLMQWTKEEDFKHPERVGKVFALIPWILANPDNVKLMSGKGQHQMRTYFLEKLGAMGSYDEKQEPLRVLCPAKRWRNEGQFLDAVRENPDEKELGEEFAAEEAEKRAEAKKRAQELAQQEAQEEAEKEEAKEEEAQHMAKEMKDTAGEGDEEEGEQGKDEVKG